MWQKRAASDQSSFIRCIFPDGIRIKLLRFRTPNRGIWGHLPKWKDITFFKKYSAVWTIQIFALFTKMSDCFWITELRYEFELNIQTMKKYWDCDPKCNSKYSSWKIAFDTIPPGNCNLSSIKYLACLLFIIYICFELRRLYVWT